MPVPQLTELLILSKAQYYPFFLRRNLNISTDYKQNSNIEWTLRTKNGTQKNRTEPQEHARTRTPKNPYQKLPNGTTMLRNAVASKAAAGLVNTSNGETIAVLTPQEEFTAANAEIERR